MTFYIAWIGGTVASFFFLMTTKVCCCCATELYSAPPRAFFRFSAPLTCASKAVKEEDRDAFFVFLDIFFPFFSIVDTCQPTYKEGKKERFS